MLAQKKSSVKEFEDDEELQEQKKPEEKPQPIAPKNDPLLEKSK